jgi:mitogen-activated protein kinase organizer 1
MNPATESITSVAVSHDANCLLVSCLDNTLRLFDRSNGELLTEYKGHLNTKYRINSCFTNDDAFVISGSEDNQIYFWDLVEGKVVHTLKGHKGVVTCVAHHPEAVCLVSTSQDGSVKVWKQERD